MRRWVLGRWADRYVRATPERSVVSGDIGLGDHVVLVCWSMRICGDQDTTLPEVRDFACNCEV